MNKISVRNILDFKFQKKIAVLTAYDFLTAKILDESGIEIILVGDSLGNVFQGQKNTLDVTMENMLYHTQVVSRAVKQALLVADMPAKSYDTVKAAVINARILIDQGPADAVKVEVNGPELESVQAITSSGIAVMGHIGFTPQSLEKIGGYKVQGRGDEAAQYLVNLAKKLEACGCFSLVVEMVTRSTADEISKAVKIPVIGIGASSNCDGQVLVTADLLGLTVKQPKFVKKYANLAEEIKKGVSKFKEDVEKGFFPQPENLFS